MRALSLELLLCSTALNPQVKTHDYESYLWCIQLPKVRPCMQALCLAVAPWLWLLELPGPPGRRREVRRCNAGALVHDWYMGRLRPLATPLVQHSPPPFPPINLPGQGMHSTLAARHTYTITPAPSPPQLLFVAFQLT